MKTAYGHLSYCSNIHPGEGWAEHLEALKLHVPLLQQLAGGAAFGIGLRLSNRASLELSREETLSAFRQWLRERNAYVFTMNGFPFGGFHQQRVKDQVHAPDWRTNERLQYTLRMFRLLASLLPPDMEGGISTSPLSYKPWLAHAQDRTKALEQATWNILQVLEYLVGLRLRGGPLMHLDLEPEPDGLLENSREFIGWFTEDLEPLALVLLEEKFGLIRTRAAELLRDHMRLCYDVCHFAVQYEDPETVFHALKQHGIRIGKIQLSAALQIQWPRDPAARQALARRLRVFDEPVYLHQVVARHDAGLFHSFRDLPEAWGEVQDPSLREWRAHFHVPLFTEAFQGFNSTSEVVASVLRQQRVQPLCNALEVETYTWEVLPQALKTDLNASIARELRWVLDRLEPKPQPEP